MLLVYTPKVTNRVLYIFKLIFTDILGVEILITSNMDEFRSFDGAKVSYSRQAMGGEPLFSSSDLLFETGIEQQSQVSGTKAFYEVPGSRDEACLVSTTRDSALPFDPFAAGFYLVSRYEEYLPHDRDEHGRFDPKNSIAYKKGFLTEPVVNIWAQKIAAIIKAKYPGFTFPEKSFHYIPTIDIDNAYAFVEKGLIRTIGGYARSALYLDAYEIIDRTRVLSGWKKDPFDTYDYLLQISGKYNLKPIYFFLLADYGYRDKNVPVKSRKFRSLIRSIGEYAEVGIHPSYSSYKKPEKISRELDCLSEILNKRITKSRQHFLKLSFPDTYRNLIKADITDDYTMGYASQIGFRASICTPFYFYDLDSECETGMKVHPFAVMDVTLKDILQLTPDKAINRVQQIIDKVKAVDGTFISLWHNQSLSDYREWAGWRKVYEEMASFFNF